MDGVDMSLDLSNEVNELVPECTQDTESTLLQGRSLGGHFEQLGTLKGIHVAASGTFADLPKDENDEWLGPAKDLYIGRNSLWRFVLSHNGKWFKEVTKDTMLLVIGNKPGRAKVKKANKQKIPLITYGSLLSLIEGDTTLSELHHAPRPEILASSEGWGPSLRPPEIQRDQTAAKGITFSNLKPVRKRKEIPKTPERPVPNPRVENPIPAKGVLNQSRLRKTKEPRHNSVINITLQIPSGKVTVLITALMFDCLASCTPKTGQYALSTQRTLSYRQGNE